MKLKEVISKVLELEININVIFYSVVFSVILSILFTPFLAIPMGILLSFYMDNQFE
ncbi:VraH family peptide resistance protein [Staphylococcus muscae]|uniref:VraH family protein n=1 Tax=Staphylococcus muscae TaxID=1294 RepID=A0A240BRY0_9STAP|nr:VraH family protein [Staphylococcus muscae]GGA82084.1 hypothetical protein GCM10007183_02800 [Staphylococcus muscae]SNV98611.1 Uncharacterised protein [Staphylococcus muscae]